MLSADGTIRQKVKRVKYLFQQVSGQKTEKHRLIVDHVVAESPADLAEIRKVSLVSAST